jgi:hypothetical protein
MEIDFTLADCYRAMGPTGQFIGLRDSKKKDQDRFSVVLIFFDKVG